MRNAASWAGNLIIFLKYSEFPSDAVLALTTANAKLKICNLYGKQSVMEMSTFLDYSYDAFKSQGLFIIGLIIT